MCFKICRYTKTLLLLLIAVVISISACTTVRFISDYDEPTDRALTTLQQSTDDFITKMLRNAPSKDNAFEKNRNFYAAADQQLRRMEFRVASLPKNGQTRQLIAEIRIAILGTGTCSENGAGLKDLHCFSANAECGPSREALQISRRNINQVIGAALALELAKKQGLEPDK